MWMFTTFHLGHYQPLSWLTLGIDYSIWGLNPFGYHLTNLLLHAVGSVIFYFVCRRLLRLSSVRPDPAASPWSAAFAALFFAIHPLRVESVAWITERRDVLSGVLLFASILLYLRATEGGAARRREIIGSVFLYALSLLSKASGMTLVFVLVVLDVYPLRRLQSSTSQWLARRDRAVWLEKLPFLILGLIAGAVALTAQKQAGAYVSVSAYSIGRRFGQAMYSAMFYISKTIAPFHLSPLYQVPFQSGGWIWVFTMCGMALAAITAILFAMRKRAAGLFAAWLCYLALLAPVSGLAQSGVQFVADRYSYLSCLAWALVAGAYCDKLILKIHKPYLIFVSGSVLLLIVGLKTWQQTFIWQDSGTLWRHTIAITPESSIARYNLGNVLEAERDFDGAMTEYRAAIARDPAYAEARYNLARLLARQGKIDEAIDEYREALKADPKDAGSHNNLGLLLARRGDIPQAVVHFNEALRIDPGYAKAYFNIGQVMLQQGRPKEAEDYFKRALHLQPDVAEIHEQLARALAAQGRKEEAMRQYEEALKIMRR